MTLVIPLQVGLGLSISASNHADMLFVYSMYPSPDDHHLMLCSRHPQYEKKFMFYHRERLLVIPFPNIQKSSETEDKQMLSASFRILLQEQVSSAIPYRS